MCDHTTNLEVLSLDGYGIFKICSQIWEYAIHMNTRVDLEGHKLSLTLPHQGIKDSLQIRILML